MDSVLNEFIVYWVDSNEVHTSWNAKFLQHVKYQWQRHQEQASGRSAAGGGARPTDRTKDRSITDDLSDTSWAG
ncbi:DnaT-like ssDNA-binding domain-containing protein [Luminiphilus sp.]|nr:DnaT-like ssDNA-binding domain-containing protein [Luminiphilus sp.]